MANERMKLDNQAYQVPSFQEALKNNLEYNGKIADYAHRLLEMIKKHPEVRDFVRLMEEMQAHSLSRQ